MQHLISTPIERFTIAGLIALAGTVGLGAAAHADEPAAPVVLAPAYHYTYTVQADDHSAMIDQTWCSGNLGCAVVTASCAASGGTATVWTNRDGHVHGVCTY